MDVILPLKNSRLSKGFIRYVHFKTDACHTHSKVGMLTFEI
jgi:hypothetical protein